MRNQSLFIVVLLLSYNYVFTQITPEISSWILNTTGATGYNNIPSNVQKVQYSDNNVYVSATCIPGYDIGPWAGNPNIPANQNFIFKITRHPQKNNGAPVLTGLGHIGVFTNGVSIFNPKDAMSYNNQNVWHQNAIVVEGPSFDECLGHPAPNGEYHHHLNPTCLYDDSITNVHSPIIGFAFDGYPIYGAFGFSKTDGSGAIKRMQSSYRKRNITSRTTLPDGSTASSAGPVVGGKYVLGYYIEDFEFATGSGDLDEHNGRFCVTPDYPQGMYCYFVTLDQNLVAEYPYILGLSYYGLVPAGNTGPGSGHNTINETVITYNGPTRVSTLQINELLNLYPNPATQFVQFELDKKLQGNARLSLLNSTGLLIYSEEHLQTGEQYSFDVSGLPPGMYVLKFQLNELTLSKKLILNN
jgi:hypothetical protein